MKQIDFNDSWKFKVQGDGEWKSVTLPHDAQLLAARSKDAPGGSGHAYFPGGIYEYEKQIEVPADWKDCHVELLFEGIYKDAQVSINGSRAALHHYGYTPFNVNLDGMLRYGETNTITVVADNEKLPNSRWYTGGGIYRPVSLLVSKKTYLPWQGVKINTLSIDPAKIRVRSAVAGDAQNTSVSVEILDNGKVIAAGNGADLELVVPGAQLWSEESPKLYDAHIVLKRGGEILDEVCERFGIRKLEWSPKGLFVNGKETLLRGGCIHHDNGILGAAEFAESAKRKIRILRESGFNAVRIAHNPASTALLNACDEYGMYVMDEAFDMWYNRKNPYDYGCNFEECWKEDITALAEHDFNHPSVLMYSIGNEVAEPHEERGQIAGQKMIDLLHELDPDRPVTCGVNLMIIGRAAKGNGIYQDGKQNTGADKPQKEDKASNGSLAFNIMASFIGTGMNKGGNSKKVDAISTPFCDALDIAGYNYGSGRYPLDGTAHPNRILVGSETFPQDICKNWEMVKKYPYLIGDFMWTSWDYLGEAGIGAWSYTGGVPFNRPYPWLLAGAGVIDILGTPDASCRYAAVVWDQIDHPVIGVRPVNHPGVRPSKSVWRGTNAMESWSWKNCEGNKAYIEVYSKGDGVELFLNGKSLGKKKLKDHKAVYKTSFQPGTLTAVSYDAQGKKIAEHSLVSANGSRQVAAVPENTKAGKGEIVYVDIEVRGENGIVESNDDRTLTVTAEGAELLGFGSANPCTEESYTEGKFKTYYGRAQAVVRVGKPGAAKIIVKDGDKEVTAVL